VDKVVVAAQRTRLGAWCSGALKLLRREEGSGPRRGEIV
jgi:hypothetical protein